MRGFLNRSVTVAFAITGLTSCGPRPIETGPLVVSDDFRGLTDEERRADEWAAFSLTIPAEIVPQLDKGVFTNLSLHFFPCPMPLGADGYGIAAYLDGAIVMGDVLRRVPPGPVTLTFYMPRDRRSSPMQSRPSGDYDCAKFMSKGPWLTVYVSPTFRLPSDLEFHRLPPRQPPSPEEREPAM